jgi:dTDP-4-amino-4,6-dideoxygalactose transaminase
MQEWNLIPFNRPTLTGDESEYLSECVRIGKFSGDGSFTKKCHLWMQESLSCRKALLTTSCTHALEMCAILLNLKPGDEVIIPSFTFSSSAGAFALHGAKIVFVDIHPDTMNIDETLIEPAITLKTRAIVVVHYAGVSCEMDTIMKIAEKHNLLVIEDAAQGFMSFYKGRPLGTIGHLGTYSFHETKNIQCGEGGALIINDLKFYERAEIIREKGTDRSRFFRGEIDKYGWVDVGSSYLPSELNASFLYSQFIKSRDITKKRLLLWDMYHEGLGFLGEAGIIRLPVIPKDCEHNAHTYFIKLKDEPERDMLMKYLKEKGITTTFHYLPLHSSVAGLQVGKFSGEDRYTTIESERLLRLPLYYELKEDEVLRVVSCLWSFFHKKIGSAHITVEKERYEIKT